MKSSIRDKIQGNELDLSLNELTEVPVQDLVVATKATHLDLSCNKIKALPNNFSSLIHLVKIDLSKNFLSELPHNFGNLVNMQYLDLYGNQIIMLPISFCRLKNLKWLDLKNNPLDPKLKIIAGDCLDEKQCLNCAKHVVSFMQSIESELERQKQKKLKEERVKQAEKLAKEAIELAEQRKLKKEEREKRKARTRAKTLENTTDNVQNETRKGNDENVEFRKHKFIQSKQDSYWRTLKLLLILIVANCTIFGMFIISTDHHVQSLDDLSIYIQEICIKVQETTQVWWHAFAIPYFASLQNWTQSVM